jgi:hypothetical protein
MRLHYTAGPFLWPGLTRTSLLPQTGTQSGKPNRHLNVLNQSRENTGCAESGTP